MSVERDRLIQILGPKKPIDVILYYRNSSNCTAWRTVTRKYIEGTVENIVSTKYLPLTVSTDFTVITINT